MSTWPVRSSVAVCESRVVAIEPVAVHDGSTTSGYATPAHAIRTWQTLAPGGVSERPHGGGGAAAYAHPARASLAAPPAPPASPRDRGATRRGRAPPASRNF